MNQEIGAEARIDPRPNKFVMAEMSASDGEPFPSSDDKRTDQRSSMFLAAVMRAGAEQAPVKVRNMSANGAMVETPLLPTRGTSVDLMRGPLVARGTVIWSSVNRCGLSFPSEVSVKDWLAAPTAVHQKRVDEMVALVKAAGVSKPDSLPADHSFAREGRTQEQLVDDVGAAIRLMHDLEDDLASSDETLVRHARKLQNLDIAMQILRAVCAELMPNSHETVSLARLNNLRVACAKALDD